MGDTGLLTGRSSDVGGLPGIEMEMARNLWEVGSQESQVGDRLGDIGLETKGLGHLSTVVPSYWLKWGQVPLHSEESASEPTRAGLRLKSL